MTLWILAVSSFTIVDTGICRYLDGTKTVRGSFRGWSCNTTKSYMPSRRPAICFLKVFLQLRNLDGIFNWASLASVEYRSHTCTRSRISACFADCSSSWQIHSNCMSLLGSDSMRLALRSNLFLQVTWYLPSAAIRSFTQTSRTLKNESYFAACRISAADFHFLYEIYFFFLILLAKDTLLPFYWSYFANILPSWCGCRRTLFGISFQFCLEFPFNFTFIHVFCSAVPMPQELLRQVSLKYLSNSISCISEIVIM